jgi:hypothetical protein
MIRKTYIPAKPRNKKLVPDTQKNYDRIISSLSEQVGKPQPEPANPLVIELKSYLELVNTDLARLTGVYNLINDSTVIGAIIKAELDSLKNTLDMKAGEFITYTNNALSDDTLTTEEVDGINMRKSEYLSSSGAFMAFAEPISKTLIVVNILNDDLAKYAREKAQIEAVYPDLHGHQYITGGTKAGYASSKTAYDSAYSELVNAINSYISDGTVTPSESAQAQYYVDAYNTRIAEYRQYEEKVRSTINLVAGYYEKLRTYEADKSRADDVYSLFYDNIYLVGADKTAYASAKTAYDTAYTNVVSGINTIISTGTLTPSEISAVSDLIDEYLSKLSLLIAAEETARKAIGEEQKRQAQVYAESLFDDVVETQTALENSLLKYSESINPITAQMMQLIVGDESLQFYFVESKANPVRVSHSVSYLSGTLTVYAGWIKHITLGITDISPTHEYKFWNVPLSAFGSLDPDKYYYLYAKCSASAETGEYILSETPVEIDGVSGYYHLLLGLLNSENNSTRRFAQLYGFTEILPGRITTDRIVSQDGKTYFDLVSALLNIGDGKIMLDGSDGSGSLASGNITWDAAGNSQYKGKITATSGEIGSLTISEGGYIDLPPSFSDQVGRLDNTGLLLIYDGSNSQKVEWYSGMGTYAGQITCDPDGYLKLSSSFGVGIGTDLFGDAITVTPGDAFNNNIDFNSSVLSNVRRLHALGRIELASSPLYINPGTNVSVSIGDISLLTVSTGSGGGIYRILNAGGAAPSSGQLLIIVNVSSSYTLMLRPSVAGSNIRTQQNKDFSIDAGTMAVLTYSGYWYVHRDYGQ